MSEALPIRVVGVGSPLGDDAVAWQVVRSLRDRVGPCPAIEFHVVEGGQRLLDVLDGLGTLVLVDALRPDGRPGTVQRFEWPDPRVEVLRPGSTHIFGPAEALQVAAALGLLPPRVVIFGVEGVHLHPNQELSPAAATAVPELVRGIEDELERAIGSHLPGRAITKDG